MEHKHFNLKFINMSTLKKLHRFFQHYFIQGGADGWGDF